MKIVIILAISALLHGARITSHSDFASKLLFPQLDLSNKLPDYFIQVYKTLDDLTEEIQKEQLDHDRQIEQQGIQCAQEMAYRQKEISLAKFSYSRAESENDNCQSSLSLIKIKLSSNENDQNLIKKELGRARGTRVFTESYFKNKTSQNDELLSILEESQEYYTSPVSFSELSELASHLLDFSAQNNAASQIAPTLTSLAQISADSNSIPSEKVNQLLEVLKIGTQESRGILDKLNLESSEVFNDLISRLNSELQRLEQEEKFLQERVGELENCIESQQNIMFQASDKDFRDSGILRSVQRLCNDWKDQHGAQSKLREDEIGLIGSLKNIGEKRFDKKEQGAAEKAGDYEKDWEKYLNEISELSQ
ncbi:unnamed protein product [Blepharisma stoltei]|uniref:Uncharacterized protein n=1 Tax=Blepharisma stoltei TaxID=1481888 RepID=A0AAU9JKT9_9CILI|nr:unnamed protein product [Blepharisma stoltei]